MEELDDMKPLTSDMYDYTVEAASKNGHLYALATNVTPGVFAYRRSIAKATFGTDDPRRSSSISTAGKISLLPRAR